jgi:hypothetical protein
MTDKERCNLWPDCNFEPGEDCKALGFTASSASGGPAGAGVASPAAPAIDPDEAVTSFRRHLQAKEIDPDASLKQRGETILAEMRAVLDRSDDALWMIKRELEHRKDLLDAAFAAHADMGLVQRDLRELVTHL